jgi:hypothetical protein
MEGQLLVRLPDNGYGERQKRLGNRHIGHVAFAGGSQAAIQGYEVGMRIWVFLAKSFCRPRWANRVAGGWAMTDTK